LHPQLVAAVMDWGPMSEVAEYLICAGGRRIRPLITLAMCEALRGRWQQAMPAAVAVELIHTASLLHDDILDGSRRRRSQVAAHRKFGTNLALLTGDMLCFAAVKAVQALPGLTGPLNAACVSMCLGQVTEDPVESARLKTGSLFRVSAQLGALVSGASEQLVSAAGNYGEQLGTVYQLRDDELDGETNASARHFAEESSMQLEHLPDSCAKELLLQLVEFAWRRDR